MRTMTPSSMECIQLLLDGEGTERAQKELEFTTKLLGKLISTEDDDDGEEERRQMARLIALGWVANNLYAHTEYYLEVDRLEKELQEVEFQEHESQEGDTIQ